MDIDADLLERLRKLAEAEGISFKDAMNRAIARGLTDAPASAVEPYCLPDLRIGTPADWNARELKQYLHDEDVERSLASGRRGAGD